MKDLSYGRCGSTEQVSVDLLTPELRPQERVNALKEWVVSQINPSTFVKKRLYLTGTAIIIKRKIRWDLTLNNGTELASLHKFVETHREYSPFGVNGRDRSHKRQSVFVLPWC
jgi:hypothetical protein